MRPSQHDLELDAIDDAFKRAIMGMYGDLDTYAANVGVGPKTIEDAKKLAREVRDSARKKRTIAIEIVNENNPE